MKPVVHEVHPQLKRMISDGRILVSAEAPKETVPLIQYQTVPTLQVVNLGDAAVWYDRSARQFKATTTVDIPPNLALFVDIFDHELEVSDGVATIINAKIKAIVVDQLPDNYYKDSDV